MISLSVRAERFILARYITSNVNFNSDYLINVPEKFARVCACIIGLEELFFLDELFFRCRLREISFIALQI